MVTHSIQTVIPPISVLFEDDQLFIINKPAGMVVNRATTVKTATVQDWVETQFEIKNIQLHSEDGDFYTRTGIVHRIDKETSGCLIVAKTSEVFYQVQALFKEHEVKKEYVALAHGRLLPKSSEITAPIGRLPWNRERFGVVVQGKEAHTKYETEAYYVDNENNSYTLVRLFPTTGRTHQLRVHLAYLGFPIVGDYLYAGRKRKDHDRKWCPRVFLHAQKIMLPHPTHHQMISASAPLAQELEDALKTLHLAS